LIFQEDIIRPVTCISRVPKSLEKGKGKLKKEKGNGIDDEKEVVPA
jgi:hypothetical protein